MSIDDFKTTLNTWGAQRTPFFFMIDFEMRNPLAIEIDKVSSDDLLFDIEGFKNSSPGSWTGDEVRILGKYPVTFAEYEQKYRNVYTHLERGDSYLLNLTLKTPVEISHSLKDVFKYSNARYKLWFRNQFVVFSPECFIRIDNQRIFSYPMKGTIDAAIPGAAGKIIGDKKELAEHVTIVDLIRNDISTVAQNVEVKRFRYIEEVRSKTGKLLQVSSEIAGELPKDHWNHVGDMLIQLLPAGSISGAPKKKTIEIIQETENEKRGYYTGVFGYFDGEQLNSGVMIRFIENQDGACFYRSGGGITTQSNPWNEYQETLNKVYVPVD